MRRFVPRFLLPAMAALALLQLSAGQTPAPAATNLPAEPELPAEFSAAPAAEPSAEHPVEYSIVDSAVIATSAGELLWSLDFTPGSGPATSLLDTGDALYVGRGNSVLGVDRDSGLVLWRTPVSGAVTRIDAAADGISVVSLLHDGLSERLQLSPAGVAQSPVRFGTDTDIFGWLRAEAEVPDPALRLQQDPTNAWLYLRAGQLNSGAVQHELFTQAVRQAATFYDLAGIARVLVLEGELELAGQAMERALLDFNQRNYTPALLTDLTLHEAYGFPLQPLHAAISQRDAAATAFWAQWLQPLATPQVPAIQRALAGIASPADAAAGPAAVATLPQARGADQFFLLVSRSGWPLFTAVLIAILALQVTLTLKYWAPQSLVLRRARETGGRGSFAARFLAIRFFSTTEKLVLVLLYAAGLMLLGLISWQQQAAALPLPLQSGTLASAEALDALDRLALHGPAGDLIRAYAEQASGDAAQPQLPAPTQLDFRLAVTGTWQQAISRVFLNPWATLAPLEFFGLPHWVWLVLLGLYLLLAVVTLLWLLVPRPRLARNAPRILPYQVLALLVPGSGLADEAWGLLLLLPWALFSMDLLQQQLGRPSLLGVSLLTSGIVLALIYALNLGAFLVELASYRRRMKLLLQAHPETAQAYGMR